MYKELKGLLEEQECYTKNLSPKHISEKELESVKRAVKIELLEILSDENDAELTEAENKGLYKILLYGETSGQNRK